MTRNRGAMNWKVAVALTAVIVLVGVIVAPVCMAIPQSAMLTSSIRHMTIAASLIPLYAADNDDGLAMAFSEENKPFLANLEGQRLSPRMERVAKSTRLDILLGPYAKSNDFFYSAFAHSKYSQSELRRLGTSYGYNLPAAAWYGTLSAVEKPAQLDMLWDFTVKKLYGPARSSTIIGSVTMAGSFRMREQTEIPSPMNENPFWLKLSKENEALKAKKL